MPMSQVEKAVLLAAILFGAILFVWGYATGQLSITKPAEEVVTKDIIVTLDIYDPVSKSYITSDVIVEFYTDCLLYTSPSPRD